MDIHKPKPVHSWRELLNEIVIIGGMLIVARVDQLVTRLVSRHA
ncbi:MAG: hypothetical protein WCL10_15350 [Novosphingobium sp.]